MTMSVHWDRFYCDVRKDRMPMKKTFAKIASNALAVTGLLVLGIAAVAIRVYVYLPALP